MGPLLCDWVELLDLLSSRNLVIHQYREIHLAESCFKSKNELSICVEKIFFYNECHYLFTFLIVSTKNNF